MIVGQDDSGDLEGLQLEALPLAEILGREDLCLEEVLSIRGIHGRIRQEMRLFIDHCARNDSFADRLITLGLKCPMHQSTSPQMKALTFIAADLLTSDHDAVADFLLPARDQHEDSEIAEEIETEETEGSPSESERYKWIGRVVEYLAGDELDENCVNYIAKSIQVLVRKRLGALLEYLRACPDVLARLAHLAHFPAIAQLLLKLITDDDEHMPPAAHDARQMIVPLLLQKLHADLRLPSALEVVDCLEQILQASRYSDPEEERSELQRLSDIIVSAEELGFHLAALLPTPSPAAPNAAAYLAMAVGRMNQDELQEGGTRRPFQPTLLYQTQPLFAAFARLAVGTGQLAGADRLLSVRWLELLVAMARHSRFGEAYLAIALEERLEAVRTLVWSVARGQFSGVLLQLAGSLIESVIMQEERIAESHPDPARKLSPAALYGVLCDHHLHLRELVETLANEAPRQRNRNQQGVFLRKLLVVLDNFFKNSEIHRHFPEVEAVASLFPTFTPEACRQYVEGAAINNHPAGLRARPPLEFAFIRRNQACLESLAVENELQMLPEELPVAVASQEEPKKPKEAEIVFKLTQKIRTLKDRVKEKQLEGGKVQRSEGKGQRSEGKGQSSAGEGKQQREQVETSKCEQQREERAVSPSKERSPMPCLLFFVRHLPIY